jgi:hypothetical protein
MSADSVPPSASDALGNGGALPEVRWQGRAYPVATPTPLVLKAVEQMVARLAWDNTQAMKAVLGPQEWAELKAETVTALQARKWAFAQPLFNEVLSGPDGNALILWGCLSAMTPAVTLGDVKRMQQEAADDCEFALSVVKLGFFSAGSATLPVGPEQRAAMVAQAAAAMVTTG